MTSGVRSAKSPLVSVSVEPGARTASFVKSGVRAQGRSAELVRSPPLSGPLGERTPSASSNLCCGCHRARSAEPAEVMPSFHFRRAALPLGLPCHTAGACSTRPRSAWTSTPIPLRRASPSVRRPPLASPRSACKIAIRGTWLTALLLVLVWQRLSSVSRIACPQACVRMHSPSSCSSTNTWAWTLATSCPLS